MIRRVVVAIFLPVMFTHGVSQCLGCYQKPEPLNPSAETRKVIEKCQAEARAEHYVGRVDFLEAGRLYDQCIIDAGM